MHFCVWRCIPYVSVERDVLHVHLLLCHFVLYLLIFINPGVAELGDPLLGMTNAKGDVRVS